MGGVEASVRIASPTDGVIITYALLCRPHCNSTHLHNGIPAVQHRAQNLRRHDHDGRVWVEGHVARYNANAAAVVPAVHLAQVVVLLVRQRLDGRRVDRLGAVRDRERHGVPGRRRVCVGGRLTK